MINRTNPDEMFSDLSNWKTLVQLAELHPQFTRSQLKRLFWKRHELPGLTRCSKLVGSKLYINEPAFGLWLSGQMDSSDNQPTSI